MRFLSLLAENGNVRLAARRCGLSAQSAYVHRRRDPAFARGWNAALLLARDHTEQVLADRAFDGVEEPVFYRGELVGTRRRYDTRLFLAHLARLDQMESDAAAQEDAGRFDEVLAVVAGEAPLTDIDRDPEGIPVPRAEHTDAVGRRLEDEAERALNAADAEAEGDDGDGDVFDDEPDEDDVREELLEEARAAGRVRGRAEWDGWRDRAWARVDALLREEAAGSEADCASEPCKPVNLCGAAEAESL